MSARTLDILSLYERNQEATLYVGNVDPQVDEELLWEFFIQVGLVKSIHIPRDKVTGQHQGYGFVEFETEDDADYAVRVLNFIKLYNKPLRCNKASRDKQNVEVGANLFVGNIDDEVDEKLLHDTFSTFGNVILTKIVREGDGVNEGRSYAFISYDNFESSDAALAAMNGQFICNKPIHVSYAYKKDTKGERHGSAAERLIAANRPTEFLNQMGVAPYGSSQMSSIPTYSQGSVMSPPMTNVYQTNIHPSMLPQANLVSMPPLPMQTYNR